MLVVRGVSRREELASAIVEALRRVYGLRICGAYAWDGTPDVVKEVAAGQEAEALLAHDGVTIRLCGERMLAEVDVYADESIPMLAGILAEPADAVAESPTTSLCQAATAVEEELRRRLSARVECLG
jgi:hypothetical protein